MTLTTVEASAYCELHGVNLVQNDHCALCLNGIGDLRGAALCDVCDKRPGTGTVWAFGIETWACDECRGEKPEALTDDLVTGEQR